MDSPERRENEKEEKLKEMSDKIILITEMLRSGYIKHINEGDDENKIEE